MDRFWQFDFPTRRIASVSFFDEALGLLARKFDLKVLQPHVSVENMDPGDRHLLNRIVLSRAKEREVDSQPGEALG